jgi:hypothetical protein
MMFVIGLMLLVLVFQISDDDHITTITLPSGQTATIVSLYEGAAAYLDRHETPDEEALLAIVEPYLRRCYPEIEVESRPSLIFPEFRTMPQRRDEFREKLAFLRDLNVESVIAEAFETAAAELPGADVTICVVPMLNPFNQRQEFARNRMYGIGGGAGPGVVTLELDLRSEDWADWLAYVMAHEYHHHVLLTNHMPDELTLLDSVLIEGRADTFATLLYPEIEAPWTAALTAEQEAEMWQAFQNLKDTTNPAAIHSWHSGDSSVPLWRIY